MRKYNGIKRKKIMFIFGMVLIIATSFFYLNNARMDDFTSLITDTTVQYQEEGAMKDYTADVHLKDNTPLSITIKAAIPQGTLASIEETEEDTVKNETLTYSLPEQLKVEDVQANKLYLEDDLVNSIGSYEIKNNVLTMNFDEEQINTNAENELKIALVLDTDSSHITYDTNGTSTISFNKKTIELNKYIEQPVKTTVTNQMNEQGVEEVVTTSNYATYAVSDNYQNEEEIQTGNIETTDQSVDFGNYLTCATVMKNVNGHWQKVENNTFTDGDQVQVSLSYQLPPNTVHKNNKVIYYQLPDGVRPTEEHRGEVIQRGEVVGHYIINTDGKILIEFNDDFADGEAFIGDIQFEGTISKTGDGDRDEINFGNDTEKIIVTKKKDNYDLDLKKQAQLSEDKSKINYQIVASTKNGTGESLKITDNFVSNTNAKGTYDQSSMKLYKVSADGTSTGVVGVTHRTWAVDKSWKNETVSAEGQRKYNWYASVVIPEGNLTEFTYVDTIKDAIDENGNMQKDTHYAIASELDAELKKNVHLNSNNGYLDHSVDFEFIYKDADGNVIEATDNTKHVKSFEIKVRPKNGQTITNAQRLSIDSYSTNLDTSHQIAGESWKFSNTGKKDDLEKVSTHSYSKPKPVVKQGGVKSKYDDRITYQNGTVSADLEKTNGILYYRVLINTNLTDNEAIHLTDIISEGAKYVEGSLQAAFYDNDYYSYSKIESYDQSLQYTDPSGWDSHNNKYVYDLTANKRPTVTDANGQINITIPRGYNYNLNSGSVSGRTIQLTYQMTVSDDTSWNNPNQTQKTYKNKVTWGNNSDSQKTEMTRELSEVKKNGAQIYNDDGTPTGKVKYNVVINPASKDLDNKSDTLKLRDRLTLPSGASATLSLDETKLYYLDLSNRDNNYHGEVVDSSLYRIAYDDINNEISVIVPDKFACVLEYTYVVDEGNIAGNYQISNSATLNGQFESSVNTNVMNLSSSATAEKGKLKIYKVDDKDYTKRLTGAEFDLAKFDEATNQWIDITQDVAFDGQSIKTNENGEIIFQGDESHQILYGGTIYRLTETKAPANYDLSSDPYYFVLVRKNQHETIASTRERMQPVFKRANADINQAHFFNNNEEVYMYIPNHTSNVNVHKVWVDSENKQITQHPDSINVNLIQNIKIPTGVNVKSKIYTLDWEGKENIVENKTLLVREGGSIKMTLPVECEPGNEAQNVSVTGATNFSFSNDGQWYGHVILTINNVTPNMSLKIKLNANDGKPVEYDYDREYSTTRNVFGTVTLDDSNDWSHTWKNVDLPKQVGGNDCIYTVEEDVPSGYQVSYTNNDGIQEGDITVTNKELDNYDLPDTGGFGTFGYYAIGALFITATLFAVIAINKKKEAYGK